MRNKFIKLASQLLLVGGLMIVSLPAAWGCTPGDWKCGEDGLVMKCHPGHIGIGGSLSTLNWKKCPSGENCWVSTRGFDDFGNYWSGEKCSKPPRIVCEPGIRRCRAGYVQECNDEGTKWENVTHVIYDGFDIFDVLGVDEDRGYTKCKSHDISED